MDRLDLVHVLPSVAPEDGGPAAAAIQLCNALASRGHRVTVLTTGGAGLTRSRGPDSTGVVNEEGVRYIFRRTYPPRRFSTAWRQVPDVWTGAHSAQLLHVHGYYTFQALVASVACRVRRAPYLVQPHGAWEPNHRVDSARVKRVFDQAVGRRIILRGADGILFTDQSEACHAADIVPRGKAYVAPLGAALPERTTEPSACNWWTERLARGPRVLFLGRIARKKRLDLVLEAWSRILAAEPNANLIIAGERGTALERTLRSDYPVANHPSVHWAGLVTGSEKAAMFGAADVFVLPSDGENFGLSVAEALLAGVPVVVTRHVALAKLIAEHSAGVVLETQDAQNLVSAVLGVLTADATRARMRLAAQSLARQHLTWGASAEAHEHVYRAIIETRKPRDYG